MIAAQKVEVGLLMVALVRVAMWLFLFYTFAGRKRIAGTLGCALSSVNSFVFALANARVAVPQGIVDTATVVATPALTLVLLAVVFGTSPRDSESDSWRL